MHLETDMKAIETLGVVDQDGRLIIRERIPLPPNADVRVIVLTPEDDELSETEWLRSASSNEAFDFLRDPAEDIYRPSHGRPFHDTE